jgi:dipeptidyl aminopeptidase/acylaminoacyl peptidase
MQRLLRSVMMLTLGVTILSVLPGSASAQGRGATAIDTARARRLYVSNKPEDQPSSNFAGAMASKALIDSTFAARSKGVLDYSKVTYRSRIGDMDIPAYIFQPLNKRGAKGHAALVWVHGGVHGNWDTQYWPFIREAVERGYIVICPEYRGSTGYGEAHHRAIDYGGYEVDDVITAHDYLTKNLPHVDPARVAIMGWSHGGYISLLSVMRPPHPFKAAVGIVPVSNLIFRLSYKGPGYQNDFSTMPRVQGLPFEKREIYKERSPYYQIDKLNVPLLVHVATNDEDVNFEEASALVYALRAQKPELAETKIYENPAPGPASGGHTFSRRVNRQTLERDDSPAQRDSWNRVWAFLEWNLRPYEGK